jgi:DNA-binding NarL/FixJ family response regulator
LCGCGRSALERSKGPDGFRERGERPFTGEDRDVLQLLQLEAPRLFPACGKRLPPRARATLDLLLVGLQDKEIASSLDLSVHTVREYVKMIYRVYGVHSRSVLIASLRRGAPRQVSGGG